MKKLICVVFILLGGCYQGVAVGIDSETTSDFGSDTGSEVDTETEDLRPCTNHTSCALGNSSRQFKNPPTCEDLIRCENGELTCFEYQGCYYYSCDFDVADVCAGTWDSVRTGN